MNKRIITTAAETMKVPLEVAEENYKELQKKKKNKI